MVIENKPLRRSQMLGRNLFRIRALGLISAACMLVPVVGYAERITNVIIYLPGETKVIATASSGEVASMPDGTLTLQSLDWKIERSQVQNGEPVRVIATALPGRPWSGNFKFTYVSKYRVELKPVK
jgi:hypothetical protein